MISGVLLWFFAAKTVAIAAAFFKNCDAICSVFVLLFAGKNSYLVPF